MAVIHEGSGIQHCWCYKHASISCISTYKAILLLLVVHSVQHLVNNDLL